MVHIFISLPVFFFAVLGYYIPFLTGSVFAVGLLLYEHYKGKAITWGLCLIIALAGLFGSCAGAWIDEHDQLLTAQQQLNALQTHDADTRLATRRAQKAQMLRFVYLCTGIITQLLPSKNGQLFEDDPAFQKYSADADKWLSDTSTWILENLGERAQNRFLDIGQTVSNSHDGPEPVNEAHSNIMSNLQKYRQNLIYMINGFATGDYAN